MEIQVSLTGRIGAEVKVKEKLGTISFAYFPFYVHYINHMHQAAKNGTRVMVALKRELAQEFHDKLEVGDKLQIEGLLTRKAYIDDGGVTRNWENVYCDNIEFVK